MWVYVYKQMRARRYSDDITKSRERSRKENEKKVILIYCEQKPYSLLACNIAMCIVYGVEYMPTDSDMVYERMQLYDESHRHKQFAERQHTFNGVDVIFNIIFITSKWFSNIKHGTNVTNQIRLNTHSSDNWIVNIVEFVQVGKMFSFGAIFILSDITAADELLHNYIKWFYWHSMMIVLWFWFELNFIFIYCWAFGRLASVVCPFNRKR